MNKRGAFVAGVVVFVVAIGAVAFLWSSEDRSFNEEEWREQYTAPIERQQACEEAGGTYDECGSACEPGATCITVCVERCVL